MELMRYSFVCPNCGKEYITYVERDKYKQLVAQQQRATDIFDDHYPIFYKGIFTIGYCSSCVGQIFDMQPQNFCQEVNIEENNRLYNAIENMCRV